MSDIDILLFHEEYIEPSPFGSQSRLKSKQSYHIPPVSLETEVILPLSQQGITAQCLSFAATNWKGIARIPSSDESTTDRLHRTRNLEGRFKRLDIRCFSWIHCRSTHLC
jgi:hypothetical protein